MPKLLLVPMDDMIVFPTMDLNLPVDVSGEERVLLVPRHNGEYAKVGTIAKIADTIRLPGGARGVSIESLHRGVIVGSAEANPAENKLSNESPVGKAIIGHKKGDVVEVTAPRGSLKFKILEIKAA